METEFSWVFNKYIRQMFFCCFSAFLLMVATFELAQASAGFSVNVHGAKAMGMNTAFAAQADDPSALYYNPAGITFLKGLQLNVGGGAYKCCANRFFGHKPDASDDSWV